jgi:hypothetical protein
LLATGDRRLRADFEENYQPLQNDPSYLRSSVYAALLYLRASTCALRPATRSDSGERHYFQWAGRTFWGSIAGFSAQACLEDPVGAVADCEHVHTMRWAGTTSRL